MKPPFVRLPLALAVGCLAALAQTTATVAIDTTHYTSLNANFNGFNDEVVFPVEYFDYRFNNYAAGLTPGWVRYPSGAYSDAFDWQTGMLVPAWAAQFQGTNIAALLTQGVPWADGKGGGQFVDAANRADFLGAKLVVCVNGFTDTPQSAGQMAAFAKANHIPVAVWELSNEPYLYSGFFSSGLDYVTKMKPYRDAIKAADPNAVVAVFFMDAGDTTPDPQWDKSVLSYPSPYWDAVTYHHYPPQSTGDFSQWMEDENAVLASKSSAYVTGYLGVVNPPGTRFLISEYLPSSDGLGTGTSLTDGTLYGAVYAAEYMMRMSAVPSMLYVGPHALTGTRGVNANNFHFTDAANAYADGTTIDTLSLSFGYFYSAQPLGVGIVGGVLRGAAQVDATILTGGPTVAATGLGQIPALYAQAYTSATGQQSVMIANKGAAACAVTIALNGAAASGTFLVEYIAGADPTVTNTASAPAAVAIQTLSSANPVNVPAYSVVRVDLNTPAGVSASSSASLGVVTISSQEIVTLQSAGIVAQSASAQPPASSLGGASVQITDSSGKTQAAQLFASGPGALEILTPAGMAAGAAKITVVQNGSPTLTGSSTVANSSPSIFSMNLDGAGVAAADALLYSNSGKITSETVASCDPSTPRSCLPSPLPESGSSGTLYVELYGTGIRGASSVLCYVAGQSVPVLYAGPQFQYLGLDQINISIPAALAGTGTARLYVLADGVYSNTVTLSLE